MTDIEALIARSSLGTPEAVALRDSVPDEVARRCVERAKELAAQGVVLGDGHLDEDDLDVLRDALNGDDR